MDLGVGSQTISKCWTRCFNTAINEGWIWRGTEQWARYYRTGEWALFNHGDWIMAWENKMLPCMFWPLGLEVIAEVRTQNNSSLNPGHILLFIVGDCRDFFISRINRKGQTPWVWGSEASRTHEPGSLCHAAGQSTKNPRGCGLLATPLGSWQPCQRMQGPNKECP